MKNERRRKLTIEFWLGIASGACVTLLFFTFLALADLASSSKPMPFNTSMTTPISVGIKA